MKRERLEEALKRWKKVKEGVKKVSKELQKEKKAE